jgi:hypothetical protein
MYGQFIIVLYLQDWGLNPFFMSNSSFPTDEDGRETIYQYLFIFLFIDRQLAL